MNIAKGFVALGLSLVFSGAVQAATVTYTIYQKAGNTFELTAKVTSGDNGGLSGYGIDLVNATVTEHSSPSTLAGQKGAVVGPAGFSLARSATGGNFVTAFQDIANATVIPLYNVGIEASSYAAQGINPLAPPTTATWDAEILLAKGTYTGAFGMNLFNQSGPNKTANVFTSGTATTVRAPETLNYAAVAIPEPATTGLAGMVLIGLAAFRRRNCV